MKKLLCEFKSPLRILVLLFSTNFIFAQDTLLLAPGKDYQEIQLSCVKRETFVIKSQGALDSLIHEDPRLTTCINYSPPYFDFSNEVILGINLEKGGCSQPSIIEKGVIKNVKEKKYTFYLTYHKYGLCKALHFISYYIKISHYDPAYSIEIKTLEDKNFKD